MSRLVTGSADDHARRVSAAVDGDADALSELLAEFGPQVEAGLLIHRRWRGLLDPSDVMQVTYLEAFLAIRSFRRESPGQFLPWLRRLAENNLNDALRALGRRKRSPAQSPYGLTSSPTSLGAGSDSRDVLLETLLATSSTPSQHLRRDEAVTQLDDAIARLPADYATVVRAHDLQGTRVEEIARQLGRSVGAVHMLRARAHQRLAAMLASASTNPR